MRYGNIRLKSPKIFHISRRIIPMAGDFTSLKLIKSNSIAFGVIVSKKVGKAVERNYQKRRLRSIFRDIYKSSIPNIHGYFIITAKKDIKNADYHQLQAEVQQSVKQCLNK